jgi:hypothetical protein
MKIACFGCSYTYGINECDNWVKELACLCPSHEIYNFSAQGASNAFIIDQAKKYSKQFDFSIVKITSSARLTFSRDDLGELRQHSKIKNYYDYDMENLANKLCCMTAGYPAQNVRNKISWISFQKDISRLYKLYYRYCTEYSEVEREAYVSWAALNVDFVYQHYNSTLNIPSVESFLPNWTNYFIDKAKHLTKEGSRLEAIHLKKLLNL